MTKDKREKKKKNWVCWLLGLAVLLAVIIVAILAGSGVIFNENPTPVESRQFAEGGDQVASAGVFGSGGNHIPRHENKTTTTDYPLTSAPPGSTVPAIPPTTEENIVYVPNTIEGQITLANLEFLEEYRDQNSSAYKVLAAELEEEIRDSLSSPGARDEFYVKILSLK